MGIEPDARLLVDGKVDVRGLPLTPSDFFLFSRVEALGGTMPPRVADVIAASGQAVADAEGSIAKLIELGLLVIAADEAPVPRPRQPSTANGDLRKRARERKRGLLTAQMRAAEGSAAPRRNSVEPGPPRSPSNDEASLPTPRDAQKPAESSVALRSILDTIEPVGEDDERLDPAVAIPLERQRRLLALRDRLRHVGHFELLGLTPLDDPKAIRRAYHVVSREFHPDAHYGKELGRFHAVLDDLFRRARSSYEFLLDPTRRKTLVDAHQAQVRETRERRLKSELEARAAAHAAQEEERRRDEARAQEERERAERARAQRDRQRQERLRDRALAERRKQATAHAEQALREREQGRHGTAATLFRLAHEEDPTNPDYERQWRESLAIARRQRAELSFARGRQALEAGHLHDAARAFGEAAEADPSLRNLTQAAAVMAEVDPAQARSFAMTALEMLAQARARGDMLDERSEANLHQACAKAFLAAGQLASAREQAERAHKLLNNKQTRALLNSIKLP
ncbi:MAG: J domain-containing protein [Enhygromyxa sp.]